MNKEQQKFDEQTRNLLQKSILIPASEDFDDRIMEKVLLAPSPSKLKSNGYNTRKALMFLIVAVVCFLLSTLIISRYYSGYVRGASMVFSIVLNYVFYGGLVLFIPLVLFHFDSLIHTIFSKKDQRLSMI